MFQYSGVTMDKLEIIGPIIASNLPVELGVSFNMDFRQDSEVVASNLQAIVQKLCDRKPANFGEYISHVMFATFMELLKYRSTHTQMRSAELMAHTFNTNVTHWHRDEEKVSKKLHYTLKCII